MGFRIVAAALCSALGMVTAGMTGCASGPGPDFRDIPSTRSVVATTTPLGVYPASSSISRSYGIAEWRTYVGKTQIVTTGYRTDGTPVLGAELAWFPSSAGSVGHTRLTMLDGSGAALRRMVDGTETGHLSSDQVQLLQAMRSDLASAPASGKVEGSATTGAGSLHLLDGTGGLPSGNTPGTGPQCFDAWANPSIPIDGAGCGFGAATFETVMGAVVAVGTCAQWYGEVQQAQATCDAENSASCNTDTPPSCSFGQDAGSASEDPAMPQAQCDQACICANYGVYNGMPCSQTCVDNSACGSGQECHWGSCGPAAAANDVPTNQNVSQQNSNAPSCSSGDVTADPSTGQVTCSTSSDSSPGASSGSSSGGSAPDPTGDSSNNGSQGAGGSGGSASCAGDGAACAQDSDCCVGGCSAGACGAGAGDGSGSPGDGSSSSGGSGSSSGGGCAADGDSCAQDSDCCGGSCDTSSGTCGSGSGGSSSGGSSGSGSGSSSGGGCAADGDPCAQDSDCCGGSCDTSSGTCGSGSGGSSSGGGGGSSSGGSCGNPGDPCSQDTDCCSGSCDSGSSSCN